jgi:hypothetical protein
MGSRELVILEEGKIRRVQDKERTARIWKLQFQEKERTNKYKTKIRKDGASCGKCSTRRREKTNG